MSWKALCWDVLCCIGLVTEVLCPVGITFVGLMLQHSESVLVTNPIYK